MAGWWRRPAGPTMARGATGGPGARGKVRTMSDATATVPRRRLRVLVEAPAPYSFSVLEAARMSECEVAHCTGPRPGMPCPVLRGAPCQVIAGSDVLVASLGLDTDLGRRILNGVRELHPEVPVVVLAWRADLTRHAEDLEGCRPVLFPWTYRKLCAAVHEAASATI